VDIPLGSALESAYSVLGLGAVIPVGQRGQGDDLSQAAQHN
jgi:hypothetical protein